MPSLPADKNICRMALMKKQQGHPALPNPAQVPSPRAAPKPLENRAVFDGKIFHKPIVDLYMANEIREQKSGYSNTYDPRFSGEPSRISSGRERRNDMSTSDDSPAPKKSLRSYFRLRPSQAITLSFAAMILCGAVLLNLPAASRSGESVGFLNALFTATSANCVTGLVVVNTLEHWTVLGKIVILMLIQFGGLGLIPMMTLGMALLNRRISLRSRLTIQSSFNQDSVGGMVRLVRRIAVFTLAIEGLGAVLLTAAFYFSSPMSPGEALVKGIFHSISAFCNAGFDIIGRESLIPYQTNPAISLVIMALIVLGGLGFPVLVELFTRPATLPSSSVKFRLAHFSLHSKVALITTGGLIVGGIGLFLLLEWANPDTLGPIQAPGKVLAATFQSVTLRTCGFNTIDQGQLTDASKFLSSILMLIGGSPAGTAGGIKTVTFALVILTMMAGLRGREETEAFGRSLPSDLLQKALTVMGAMLILVVASVMILNFTERGSAFKHDFLDLLFEVSSAAGTVGLTTGITPHLSTAGKVVLILCMFLGRLGPITVVVSLNTRRHKGDADLTYPSERMIIG